jgi:CRP-like cAMP-binding protein
MHLGKKKKVDLLAGIPLFAALSKRQLAEVAEIADEISFPAGRTLIEEDTRGREFIIILDGQARVTRNGRKVNEIGAGSWIGEIALVADVPRTATVTTTTAVRALVVSDHAFRGLLTRVPPIAVQILASVAERLAEVHRAP